jgi:hypothetical protein
MACNERRRTTRTTVVLRSAGACGVLGTDLFFSSASTISAALFAYSLKAPVPAVSAAAYAVLSILAADAAAVLSSMRSVCKEIWQQFKEGAVKAQCYGGWSPKMHFK